MDILLAFGGSDVSALTLLDLSSDFDTIDHHIPFHRLQSLYDISDTVLSWSESYLTGMTQTVSVNSQSSKPADVFFGLLNSRSYPLHSVLCTSRLFENSVSSLSFGDYIQPFFCPVFLIRYTPLS